MSYQYHHLTELEDIRAFTRRLTRPREIDAFVRKAARTIDLTDPAAPAIIARALQFPSHGDPSVETPGLTPLPGEYSGGGQATNAARFYTEQRCSDPLQAPAGAAGRVPHADPAAHLITARTLARRRLRKQLQRSVEGEG